MNTLTAVRTFAEPGFCPAKRTRIVDAKWYVVRLQNVETDPRCDYVGLGEGEYELLLPGELARRERDSRLNHCNGIAEWTGPVFNLHLMPFGHDHNRQIWLRSQEEVDAAIAEFQADRLEHIAACVKEANYQFTRTIESLKASAQKSGIGIARMDDPEYWGELLATHNRWGQEAQAAADKERDNPSWKWTVSQIR